MDLGGLSVLDSSDLLSLVGEDEDEGEQKDAGDVPNKNAHNCSESCFVGRGVLGFEEKRTNDVSDTRTS